MPAQHARRLPLVVASAQVCQARPAWPGLLLLCGLGAAWSWLFTGHLLGASNNVFHLPILADLAAQPGFADDAFVQSLKRFQSGLWILLAGADAWLPAALLMPVLLFLSKTLCLLGLVLVASEVGLKGRVQQFVFVLTMASTPLLRGAAYAGHGGLLVDYFSHSELANGLSLLLWWACLRRRFDIALALNGGIFFLNGFMAVWNLAPWLWLAWRAHRADPLLWRSQLRGCVLAALFAACLAGPIVWRALQAGQFGQFALDGDGSLAGLPAGADHRDFLRAYFPFHFLADAMPLTQWLGLAAVLLAAVLGLQALGPAAAGLRHLGLAYGAVYGVGVVLPWLTASPALLNLHLLRSSVHFHFLAAVVLGVWLVRSATSPAPLQRGWRAPWLAVVLLTVRPALLLLPLLWLAERVLPPTLFLRPRQLRALGLLLYGGVALVLVAVLVHQRQQVAQLQASLDDWALLAQRVRQASQPGDSVMLPLNTDGWQPVDAGPGAFQYHAQRPVWVDDKRGAASFWQHDYLALWRQRRAAQAAASDWPARLQLARAQGVRVVVDRCEGLPPDAAGTLLARVGRLCAVAAGPSPASRP